jgi:hypothetical protein
MHQNCMDWLMRLRIAWHDADEVSGDMLRRPRRRSLGPALHRKRYAEAAERIEKLIAKPPEPFDDSELAAWLFAHDCGPGSPRR